MRCKYPERDLSQRLDQTICRYKGAPFYVRYNNQRQFRLYKLSEIKTQKYIDIFADDPDFDISTIPLGYFNYDLNYVSYVRRIPQRIYKQGVTVDSLRFCDLNDKPIALNPYIPSFEEMVMDIYPSLPKIFKDIEKEIDRPIEKAVSRNIALKLIPKIRIIEVFFKTEKVGWINEGTNTVIVTAPEKGWIVSKYLSGFDWKVE